VEFKVSESEIMASRVKVMKEFQICPEIETKLVSYIPKSVIKTLGSPRTLYLIKTRRESIKKEEKASLPC